MNKSALLLLLVIGLLVLTETKADSVYKHPIAPIPNRWRWNQMDTENIEDLLESFMTAQEME
uniref:Uncharacterized protein n=1 Tax=Ciona intestinalis TaxID=7719 RepID=F6TCY9_CIOIN